MAILCGWPGQHGVQGGKGCGIWTDGGIGGMVCVCSWDEREAAGSWAVSLFLFHPRAAGQRMRDDGEKGTMESRSQKKKRGRRYVGRGRGRSVRWGHEVFMTRAEKRRLFRETGENVSRTMLAAGGVLVQSHQH